MTTRGKSLRFVFLGVLAFGEILALSWIARNAYLSPSLLVSSRHVFLVTIGIASAFLLYGPQEFQDRLTKLDWISNPATGMPQDLLAGSIHVACFALCALRIGAVIDARAVALGSVAAASWALLLAPAKAWLRLFVFALPVWIGALVAIVAGLLGETTRSWWRPLSGVTLRFTGWLLGCVQSNAVTDLSRFEVGVSHFNVTIADPCSGYEGIGLITVFLVAYMGLFHSRLRFPRALALLPLGIVLMWLSNSARIALLVLIGAHVSERVALGGFHSQMGWILFCSIGLSVVAFSEKTRFFQVEDTKPKAAENPSGPYVVPFLVLIGGKLVLGAFTSGFDSFYPLGVLAVGIALYSYRHAYAGWNWRPSPLAILIGAAVYAIWIALEPAKPLRDSMPPELARLPALASSAWIALRVLGSVVTVSLAEELAFRGFLIRRLQSPDFLSIEMGKFTWPSFLLSSLLFGWMHQRWLAGTLAGMLFAAALARRKHIADAIFAHATANALIAIHVLWTGQWSLWL